MQASWRRQREVGSTIDRRFVKQAVDALIEVVEPKFRFAQSGPRECVSCSKRANQAGLIFRVVFVLFEEQVLPAFVLVRGAGDDA